MFLRVGGVIPVGEYCVAPVSFKVTPSEKVYLKQAARRKGIPLSRFIRGIVVSNIPEPYTGGGE